MRWESQPNKNSSFESLGTRIGPKQKPIVVMSKPILMSFDLVATKIENLKPGKLRLHLSDSPEMPLVTTDRIE